jgi:beta-lactamase class A
VKHRRPRKRFALGAGIGAVSVLSALVAVAVLTTWSGAAAPAPSAKPPAPRAASPAPSTPSPTATPKSTRAARKALTRALDRYLDDRSGSLSLSVRDQSTGFTYTYAPKVRTGTASIVKVDILIAVLLRAQQAGRGLTASENALAGQMIKFSDNNAANSLWFSVGGVSAVAAANERLRLRDTDLNPVWGATTTSAADQVRILNALTSAKSPLSAENRRYALGLMAAVTPEQAWGVSAAAAKGDSVSLKNGWLPRPADGNRWTINSIGRVRGSGHDYLIAVLSKQNASMTAGIQTVEHATKLVTKAAADLR